MSEPFLAEVRMVGFNFAPRGWAFCDGQILPINQNQSLYSLLGTTYGGDGRTTFALPDLRGRVPMHRGRSNGGRDHIEGQKSGEENHTLTLNEMPQHTHAWNVSTNVASESEPAGKFLGRASLDTYGTLADPGHLKEESISYVGGSQAHNNMMPFLAVNFCIALMGLFPSRN